MKSVLVPFIEIKSLGDSDVQLTIINTLGLQDESQFELSITDLECLGKAIKKFLEKKEDEA